MPMAIRSSTLAPSQRTCANCDVSADCLFDQKRLGGFKGTRPHYVGYRIITDKIELNGAKEDSIPCYAFVGDAGLQRRMLDGRSLRDAGQDGEIIKVIAQEGETIERRIRLGFNSLGEIVRPQAEIVEDLKRAGFSVATSDSSQAVEWRDVTYPTKVPVFTEVVNRVNSYGAKIMQREMAEQDVEVQAEDQAWEDAKARMNARDEASVLDMVATAEPVKKAKP